MRSFVVHSNLSSLAAEIGDWLMLDSFASVTSTSNGGIELVLLVDREGARRLREGCSVETATSLEGSSWVS